MAWMLAMAVAFPGAEGAGAGSVGGRGGDVYHVTTLEDAGAGSLREGIEKAKGPRTIVFDLGGTIYLRSRLTIRNAYLTIAGQTAPEDGITIAGWPTVLSGSNHVILRHLRFRMGDLNCPAVQGNALWVDKSSDVMIDHVSASWSVDETLSVTDSTRVTVQWSVIAESLKNSCHEKGAHGYGSLVRFGDGRVSFLHNLFAHHDSRNPRVGDGISFKFVGNVVYDWGATAGYSGGDEEGVTRVKLLGNVFVPGPSTRGKFAFRGGGKNTIVSQAGNVLDGQDRGWAAIGGSYTREDMAEDWKAERVLERVLLEAGALVGDAVDMRLFREVRERGGKIIDSQKQVGGWPELRKGVAPVDTDGDGMPDAWETARGLNPADAKDGRAMVGDTTNLEIYLIEGFHGRR